MTTISEQTSPAHTGTERTFQQLSRTSSPTEVTFAGHGITGHITPDTLAITYSPLLSALNSTLPFPNTENTHFTDNSQKTLSIPVEDIRGWYSCSPTTGDAGWIQILPSISSIRDEKIPGSAHDFHIARSNSATVNNPLILRFDLEDQSSFDILTAVLTNLHAGYPLTHTLTNQTPLQGSVESRPKATSQESASKRAHTQPASTKTDSEQEKRSKRNTRWQKAATPDIIPEPNPQADINSPIFGQSVTITGDFAPYSKEEIWNIIAEHGGTIGKNVTKKTTMVVLGKWDSITSKEKRARELEEQGQDITILSLEDFLTLAGNPGPKFEAPPF